MGDLAASGGYWISTASDEIIADPSTVTGSIGVIALLPNFAGTLDKLGVHSSNSATTWLRSAFDPRVPLDPRLADMIQRSVDHEYRSFIARVAQARKTTPTRSTDRPGPRLVGRAGARARPDRPDRPVRRRAALGRRARQARRRPAHRLHRARAGAFSRFVSLLNAEVAACSRRRSTAAERHRRAGRGARAARRASSAG
jgi:protease-4